MTNVGTVAPAYEWICYGGGLGEGGTKRAGKVDINLWMLLQSAIVAFKSIAANWFDMTKQIWTTEA